MLKFIIILLLLFISTSNLYAYLDPASSSALLYVLIAIISILIYSFRNIIHIGMNIIKRKKFLVKDKKSSWESDIVFYSEGKQYWQVFLPIIKELEKKKTKCVYLTSGKDDPGLNYKSKYMSSKYIGSMAFSSAYLKRLKALFVGMTTPQLDVLNLKRSKGVKHYAHIVHAPVDIHTYRKFAFDYFDSVFCSGPHQIKNIRYLENTRNTAKKELYEIGLTYYDLMIEKIGKIKQEERERSVVLVAPTWKSYSLLNRFGKDFFYHLLKSESYNVILRPHPQSYISFPEVIEKIEKAFANNPRFSIDTCPSGEASMSKANLLISDLSGIIWDYSFLFSRPVLLIHTPLELDGFEATDLDSPMWEILAIDQIGKIIHENEIENISTSVNKLLKSPPINETKKLREESVYNFGNAGKIASDRILSIVSDLKNKEELTNR